MGNADLDINQSESVNSKSKSKLGSKKVKKDSIDVSNNNSYNNNIKMLIFCKTKKCCLLIRVALTYRYRDRVQMIELHGDMKQECRNQAMAQFRKGSNCILIATDLASRGIDVTDID
mmetsp:Transcript_18880/g.15458  ORF Transcript_18880/g.15458 Transcript_18880/m.15458 type:complete len:117 (+) Transcript_18880:850-1200(+)